MASDKKECCCNECGELVRGHMFSMLRKGHGLVSNGVGDCCPSCPIHAPMMTQEQVREMLAKEDSRYRQTKMKRLGGVVYALKRVLKEN